MSKQKLRKLSKKHYLDGSTKPTKPSKPSKPSKPDKKARKEKKDKLKIGG